MPRTRGRGESDGPASSRVRGHRRRPDLQASRPDAEPCRLRTSVPTVKQNVHGQRKAKGHVMHALNAPVHDGHTGRGSRHGGGRPGPSAMAIRRSTRRPADHARTSAARVRRSRRLPRRTSFGSLRGSRNLRPVTIRATAPARGVTRRAGAERRTAQPLTRLWHEGVPGPFGT